MFSADTLQQALVQDYGRLCTLANKILQDSHLAQDAVQESWLRLNQARPDTTDAEKAAPFAAGHGAPYGPEHAAEPAGRNRQKMQYLPPCRMLARCRRKSWNAARPCAACWRQCRRWKKPTAPSCSCNTGRA